MNIIKANKKEIKELKRLGVYNLWLIEFALRLKGLSVHMSDSEIENFIQRISTDTELINNSLIWSETVLGTTFWQKINGILRTNRL